MSGCHSVPGSSASTMNNVPGRRTGPSASAYGIKLPKGVKSAAPRSPKAPKKIHAPPQTRCDAGCAFSRRSDMAREHKFHKRRVHSQNAWASSWHSVCASSYWNIQPRIGSLLTPPCVNMIAADQYSVFKYGPLNTTQQSIRLLSIDPEISPEGLIQSKIHHSTIDAHYNCLSYQ
jgi:hypothetical protein